jgi:hypothetical protein
MAQSGQDVDNVLFPDDTIAMNRAFSFALYTWGLPGLTGIPEGQNLYSAAAAKTLFVEKNEKNVMLE